MKTLGKKMESERETETSITEDTSVRRGENLLNHFILIFYNICI